MLNKRIKIVITAVICAASAIMLSSCMDASDTSFYDSLRSNSQSGSKSNEAEPVNAVSFLRTKGKVTSVIDAQTADSVYSESSVINDLHSRGFDSYPINSEYSMDGEYYDSSEVSAEADDKHPMYETYYLSPDNNLWVIYAVNDAVFAMPANYNLEHQDNVPFVVTESNEIVSYDSYTNKFYTLLPNADTFRIIKADKIDTEILNKLTAEELDSYENK